MVKKKHCIVEHIKWKEWLMLNIKPAFMKDVKLEHSIIKMVKQQDCIVHRTN